MTIDKHRAAEFGLAVERYRRRRGRLPEELRELVPEFLESLPLSTATGKLFEYQRGAFDVPWLSGERRTRRVIGYATAGEDVILMKGSRHVAAIVSISEADLQLSSRLSDAKAAALWQRIDEEIADGRAKAWKGTEKVRA